jgi:hypothetical protein
MPTGTLEQRRNERREGNCYCVVEILDLYSNETKGKIDEMARDCKIIIQAYGHTIKDEEFGVSGHMSIPFSKQMPLGFGVIPI